MKISILLAVVVIGMGCQNKKMHDLILSKCNSATELQVRDMAKHYAEIVATDPSKSIQQVRMDSKVLKHLLKNTKGFRLINAADLMTHEIKMYTQTWNEDGSYTYCQIDSIFKPTQKGMKGKKPFCPPPPQCDTSLID